MPHQEIFMYIGYYGGMALMSIFALASWLFLGYFVFSFLHDLFKRKMVNDFCADLVYYIGFRRFLYGAVRAEDVCENCQGTGYNNEKLAKERNKMIAEYKKEKMKKIRFFEFGIALLLFCLSLVCGFVLGRYF